MTNPMDAVTGLPSVMAAIQSLRDWADNQRRKEMIDMLTLEKAIDLAERIVTERGRDFVYSNGSIDTCHYAPLAQSEGVKATTGCLVGEIIKAAGLMTPEIAGSTSSIGALVHNGALDIDHHPTTLAFLRALQTRQDCGQTWGEALDAALSTVSHLGE